MAKHAKSKSNARPAGSGASGRPAPYTKTKGKQARVEVKFEGPSGSSATTTNAGESKVASTSSTASASGSKAKPVKPAAAPAPSTKEKGKSKAVTEPSTSAQVLSTPISTGTFVVVAGSYEKLLYGLEGSYPSASSASSASQSKPSLEPIFIFPAHLACVKAVAASPGGKWLATGSEDEFVKVWDLRRRKEVGSLSQHTGSITSLHFPTQSHLITTSVDSTLSLFRTSDWALLKSLKGHSGRVNHVDVHPTGRVALSVGKDMTLKMWDLMRGRGAASLPLGSEAEMVKFSQTGTHFAVLFPRKIQIYSLTLKLLHTLTTQSRFNTLVFAALSKPGPGEDGETEDEELLCVGTEKGIVEVYNITVGTDEHSDEEEEDENENENEAAESAQNGKGADVDKVAILVGHTNRIKSVSALPFAAPDANSPGGLRKTTLLATASSDGLINVYDLSAISNTNASSIEGEEQKIESNASYDTKGSRLTCVYIADGQDVARLVAGQNKKSQTAQDEEDDGEVDDDEEEDEEDIYEQGEGEGEGDDDEEMVEFEDDEEEEEEEDEEEDEEEGEYED